MGMEKSPGKVECALVEVFTGRQEKNLKNAGQAGDAVASASAMPCSAGPRAHSFASRISHRNPVRMEA
jgi:hypothetical protein